MIIIRLARDLNLYTVAEGIEDSGQRQALISLGCDSAQGFLLSRPLDAAVARELAQGAASNAKVER
jgi:diguanylate cyclase